MNSTSGKFDELNSILSVTQQRLNKFKVGVKLSWSHKRLSENFIFSFQPQTACGSLTNLLKIRGNQKTDMPDSLEPTTSNESDGTNSDNAVNQSNNIDTSPINNLETMNSDVKEIKASTSNMQQKMACQFDKLDAMINKAENAQYSMAHQSKQMKGFLK